jgi:C-terminal processing protease CtpA/Prc
MTTPFDGVEMRVSEVFPDSPASEAGLKRGDRVLTINGRTVADLGRAE